MSINLQILNKIAEESMVTTSPPDFSVISYYNTIVVGFGSQNAAIINKLFDLINSALFYISNGKYDLQWMKSQNFNFGTSAISLPELRNLMNFTKIIFYYLLNNGQQFKNKLTNEAIQYRVDKVLSSNELKSLPTNLTSKKVQEKIGGSLKTMINNYLTLVR